MGGATGHCSPDTLPPTAPAHSEWGHLSAGRNTEKKKCTHSEEKQDGKIKGKTAERDFLFTLNLLQ